MSKIRVTYTGLIGFAVRLVSMITGMMFVLIVTRELSEIEFGTWNLIGGLIAYVIVVEPIISYWITRETARDDDSAKTGLLSSTIFSTGALLAYIVIAYFVGQQSNAEISILFFASILVPLLFVNKTLAGINLGWKPQANSFGFVSSEIIKIPAALIFVYFLDMGIEGAIIATAIGYLVSISVLVYFAKERLIGKFRKEFVKKWLRLSWLPIYREVPITLFLSDVVIFSILTGSVVGVAYITVSRAIGNLVIHTQQISRGVYPKLLEGGRQEYLQENLIRVLYFAIPFVALSITFAKPGLFALNPIYVVATPVVIIITFRAFLSCISKLFTSSLQGIEKVDVKNESTFKDYIKSRLFLVPTVRLIHFSLYLAVLAIGLLSLSQNNLSMIDLIMFWAVVSLVLEIPFTMYYYILIRRDFTLNIDGKSIFKYIISSIVCFGLTFLLMENFLEYKTSIFEFFPQLIMYPILAFGGYGLLTYLIDSRTRVFVKSILSAIKRREGGWK